MNFLLLTPLFDHTQVFLGHSGGLDTEGNELPRLVYVSREKRPGFQHHKKAGAMNALVSSYILQKFKIINFIPYVGSDGSSLYSIGSCVSCAYQWTIHVES